MNEVTRPGVVERGKLRIGHPQGIITSEGKVDREDGGFALRKATVDRTARCLMKGYAFVPKETFSLR